VAGPDGVERAGPYGVLRHWVPRGWSPPSIEAFHDDAGHQVAGGGRPPSGVAVLNLKQGQPRVTDCGVRSGSMAPSCRGGVDTLYYHDLDERPGSKFAAMDLIGIPWQVGGRTEGTRRRQGSSSSAASTARAS